MSNENSYFEKKHPILAAVLEGIGNLLELLGDIFFD